MGFLGGGYCAYSTLVLVPCDIPVKYVVCERKRLSVISPKLNNDSHAPSAFVLLLTDENLVMTVKELFIVLVFLLRLVFIVICQ